LRPARWGRHTSLLLLHVLVQLLLQRAPWLLVLWVLLVVLLHGWGSAGAAKPCWCIIVIC
jgi:hypothetical protein